LPDSGAPDYHYENMLGKSLFLSRVLGLSLILTACAYANGTCNCPPTVIVLINGVDHSSSFVTSTSDGGNSYQIAGSVFASATAGAPGFEFTLNATTHPDPDIDADADVLGDPNVSVKIIQDFLGGPALTLTTTSSDTITDTNGDTHASATPTSSLSSSIQNTIVNDALVASQNGGCNLMGEGIFNSDCGGSSTLTNNLLTAPNGVMELDLDYIFSAGDSYDIKAGASMTAPTPEPIVTVPLAGGLLAIAGIVERRRRARG